MICTCQVKHHNRFVFRVQIFVEDRRGEKSNIINVEICLCHQFLILTNERFASFLGHLFHLINQGGSCDDQSTVSVPDEVFQRLVGMLTAQGDHYVARHPDGPLADDVTHAIWANKADVLVLVGPVSQGLFDFA